MNKLYMSRYIIGLVGMRWYIVDAKNESILGRLDGYCTWRDADAALKAILSKTPGYASM